MKITIIGTGYVGLVTGACLAEVGNHVFCLDSDEKKIDILNNGGIPIHEPGLLEIVARNRQFGRLTFSTDVGAAIAHGDIIFIAVGTPPDEDGSADLQYVLSAAHSIGQHMQEFKVVVDKSTVPVGTADKVKAAIQNALDLRQSTLQFAVSSNPEFLKEGAAIDDFMRPDRIVIGFESNAAGEKAQSMLKQVYSSFNRNHDRMLWMDVRSAEFTKYAANAMLATRISFMNELANLAEKLGADIEAVRRGIGSDPRIGYSFLYAGCGYGGSCFPKDVQALGRTARDYGQELLILKAVEQVNGRQKHILSRKIQTQFKGELQGKHFAIWGLAFKPNTDDMREAPSRVIISDLVRQGASITAYDPVAIDEAKRVLKLDFSDRPELLSNIHFSSMPMEALDGADALVIVTEWKAFRSPDWTQLHARLKTPIVFDGRNLFDPDIMSENGFEYYGIGRSSSNVT